MSHNWRRKHQEGLPDKNYKACFPAAQSYSLQILRSYCYLQVLYIYVSVL
jgi:hypothetical protein